MINREMVWWRILVGIELSQRGTFLKADNKKPITITVPFIPFSLKGLLCLSAMLCLIPQV